MAVTATIKRRLAKRIAQAEVAAVFRQAGIRAAAEMGASVPKVIEALSDEATNAA